MERQLISQWLKENQRTQKWLEAITGISQGHISEFLQGKKELSWENIVKICEATGIDMNALAGLKRTSPSPIVHDKDAIQIRGINVNEKGSVKIRVEGTLEAKIIEND